MFTMMSSCPHVSFILQPLFTTFLLSLLYAFISKVGYTRSAELFYSGLQSVFGRREYSQFMKNWKELKVAKGDVKKVSAQDEFAKWAKLQRKVDKLQADFDKTYSSRQKSLLAVQFVGSIILRVLSYLTILSFLYFYSGVTVISLDLFEPEMAKIPLLKHVAAFPSAKEGGISVFVWAVLTTIASRALLHAFIK